MAKEVIVVGSRTKPALHCVEVSGFRFGDAMLRTLSWVSTQRASPSAINCGGHPGSVSEFAELPKEGGLFRSQSDGARKPLPAEARSSTSRAGLYRARTCGLTFEPTSL